MGAIGFWVTVMGIYGGGGTTAPPDVPGLEWRLDEDRLHWIIPTDVQPHWQQEVERPQWRAEEHQ